MNRITTHLCGCDKCALPRNIGFAQFLAKEGLVATDNDVRNWLAMLVRRGQRVGAETEPECEGK